MVMSKRVQRSREEEVWFGGFNVCNVFSLLDSFRLPELAY